MKKIVVAKLGWVLVGDYERTETTCVLTNASVVRVWGTTKGLGELAQKGPLSGTVLDPVGTAEIELNSTLFTITCEPKGWK